MNDAIQTRTGRMFRPLSPSPSDVCIEDIAAALSKQCRYTGHTSRFYSVAEHSLRVAWRVQELGGSRTDVLWGLLHDASEAYLCDIASPVKRQEEFRAYRKAEALVQAAVCSRFGLPFVQPEVVKRADLELLSTEAHELMSPLVEPYWNDLLPPLKLEDELGWDPDMAEDMFLAAFVELSR